MEDQLAGTFQNLCIDQNGNIEDVSFFDKRNTNLNDGISSNVGDTKAVFSNHLLLQRIFANLPFEDLKSCRQVNPTLQIEATKSILKNYTTQQIQLQFSLEKYMASLLLQSPKSKPMSNSRLQSDAIIKNNDDAHNLIDLVRLSKTFPSNNLSVCMRNEDKEEEDNLQELFEILGEHIKQLQLCIHHPLGEKCPSFSTLNNLLTMQLPFLEDLCIVRVPEQWNSTFPLLSSETKQETEIKLTRLKHFTYTGDLPKNILTHIFKLAPNLLTFTCDTTIPENLTVILELKKVHLLKKFELLFTPNRVDLYEALLEFSPKFQDIIEISHWNWEMMIPVAVSRIASIISKVFESSASSLKSICRFPPLGFLTYFPILPNLTELLFNYPHYFGNADNKRMFPTRLNLAKTFPALTTVTICPGKNQDFYRNRPDQIFSIPDYGCGNVLPTVTNLYFDDQETTYEIPPNWLVFFAKFFPNLVKVKFPPFSDFRQAAKYVWRFTKLAELELAIDLDAIAFPFPALDSAFTGFSVETCRELYYFLQDIDNLKCEINRFRINPSILDLTNLQKLQLNFTDSGRWQNEEYTLVLSNIAGKYGFQMNPQLEVFIVAKHLRILNGLDKVLPFAKQFPEVLLP